MDCHDDAVQRLHYSTVAQLLTALARDAGYQPANYTLPPLNEYAPLQPVTYAALYGTLQRLFCSWLWTQLLSNLSRDMRRQHF